VLRSFPIAESGLKGRQAELLNCSDHPGGASPSRSMLMPRGKRPATAARTTYRTRFVLELTCEAPSMGELVYLHLVSSRLLNEGLQYGRPGFLNERSREHQFLFGGLLMIFVKSGQQFCMHNASKAFRDACMTVGGNLNRLIGSTERVNNVSVKAVRIRQIRQNSWLVL
jgi:hypothetical protein